MSRSTSPPYATASYRPTTGVGARVPDDGFVSDALLDAWLRSGDAVRAGAAMTLGDGRRYVLVDALRVLGRRNGETDPYGLTGSVLLLRHVLRQGGALFVDALRLGPAIYDVDYGVVATPLGGADESGALPIVR
jgi:hypothetical protein